MGKQSIIQKIKKLLATPDLQLQECHALYLMVEIRKILEQENYPANYDILRFYGNWCAHPAIENGSPFKDTVVPIVNAAIHQYTLIPEQIQQGTNLAKFLSLEFLRVNMQAFFQASDIPIDAIAGNNWRNFAVMLFGILSEQKFRPKNQFFYIEYDEDGSGKIKVEPLNQQDFNIPFHQKNLI